MFVLSWSILVCILFTLIELFVSSLNSCDPLMSFMIVPLNSAPWDSNGQWGWTGMQAVIPFQRLERFFGAGVSRADQTRLRAWMWDPGSWDWVESVEGKDLIDSLKSIKSQHKMCGPRLSLEVECGVGGVKGGSGSRVCVGA